MVIRLHKNARTPPAIRREIQRSTLPIRERAERYGLSRQTVLKWRRRSSTEDASHRPHRLHTRLTPAPEVVELRRLRLLPRRLIAAAGVRLRKAPEPDASVVSTLPIGTPLTLTGEWTTPARIGDLKVPWYQVHGGEDVDPVAPTAAGQSVSGWVFGHLS